MTVRRTALRCLSLTAMAVLSVLAGCTGDDDRSTSGGLDSARAAVDAHIAAARSYDIEADCNLLTPNRRRELAGYDGLEFETYCATVTAPIEADADDEVRERTRALYTDPVVTDLDRAGGTWFSLVSADGSYAEQIETVEVEGSWWIATIDSDVEDDGHDHEGPAPGAGEGPEVEEPPPTTAR